MPIENFSNNSIIYEDYDFNIEAFVPQDFISVNTLLDSLGIKTDPRSPNDYDELGWIKDADGNWISNFGIDPETGEIHKK